MATYKIVLFYGLAPLPDPVAVQLWQRSLGAVHGLTGRVIVSPHGINATLGGTVEALKQYVKTTRQHPAFADIDVKWSPGTGADFPRLSVKVRPELVAFGVPDEIEVTDQGVVGGGQRLTPHELHDLVEARGEDVVMLDGRNAFEAEIGRFRGAVVPDVSATRDFVAELESGRYDHLRGRPIVTYCTGGIRCEFLSALMTARGFDEVYQLDGGIVRYGETFGSAGLWEGSLYVFDGRMHVEFDDAATTLGTCVGCAASTSQHRNCADAACRTLALVCDRCALERAGLRCEVCAQERPDDATALRAG